MLQGAIPPEDALAIGRQIAEALETAHEKNVIHRDLKPANVKVTPEGGRQPHFFCIQSARHSAPEVSSSKPEPVVPKPEPAPVRAAAVSTDDIRKAGFAPFLLRQVGVWTADDAQNTIGDPVNHRYGYDQSKNIISNIYIYRDPLGTGPNFGIAFGSKTEKMSAAFLYPVGITWDQVKKMWGDDVNVVKNPDGTKFHNYKNARVNLKLGKNSNVMGIVVY